jgi:hypothetical protein
MQKKADRKSRQKNPKEKADRDDRQKNGERRPARAGDSRVQSFEQLMRTQLLLLIVALPVAGMVNAYIGASRLRRFLHEVPRLTGWHDLELYKAEVAYQMRAALVQIGLLGSPLVIFLVGLTTGSLLPADAAYVVLPSVVVFLLGLMARGLERAMREIPVETEQLREHRDDVARTWTTRPLPDW